MGRWRPPPERSSPYITPEGAHALKAWLAELWTLRRTDVVPALSAAAAEGDRSENAEYIYRKKQLAEIDRKIDDGAPNTGGFQFSRYQGNGSAAPTDGSVAAPSCTSATDASGVWNATNGSANCGGASFL